MDFRTTCVLIPLVDLINHSSEDSNAFLSVMGENKEDDNGRNDEESLYYAVIANRDFQQGEEILISYGSSEDTSMELLLNYGFVPDANQYDIDFIAGEIEDNEEESHFSDCWSTTLAKDEQRLAEIEESGNNVLVESTILKYRIRMKKAFQEYKESVTRER